MRVSAAVLEQAGLPAPFAESEPLKIQDVELLGPDDNEVLVRIAAAGICHSDLATVEGVRARPLPMVLGHEAAGVVEHVGSGVSTLKRGDHVVTVFLATCGACENCVSGRPTLCRAAADATAAGTLISGERKLRRGSQSLHHHSGVSSFAECATVSERSLVKIDPELPLEEAAIFGCAVLTGVGAAVNAAHIRLGSTVAVIGLGGVGLAGLLGARAMGAGRIMAIDKNPDKLAIAAELGATDVYSTDDPDLTDRIKDATGGGVETALEFAGTSTAVELAFSIGRAGSELVTVGLPEPSTRLSIPALSLVLEQREFRGSYMGSGVPRRDIPRFIDLYKRGRLPVDKLLTHRLPLAEINAGMDRLREGSALRQILTFNHSGREGSQNV